MIVSKMIAIMIIIINQSGARTANSIRSNQSGSVPANPRPIQEKQIKKARKEIIVMVFLKRLLVPSLKY